MTHCFSFTISNFKINYKFVGLCNNMSEKNTKHCNICLETECEYNKANFLELESDVKYNKN